MNFILGGAQLGSKYGISNSNAFSKKNSFKILEAALKNNINDLDLAINYGDSHKIVGEFDSNLFNINTKIPSLQNVKNPLEKCKNYIDKIFNDLKTNKINTIFFHDENDIHLEKIHEIFAYMEELKSKKKIVNIGLSTYSKVKLKNQIDVIQYPENYLSDKFLTNFYSRYSNLKIHIRSVFLQGVLLSLNNLTESFIEFYNLKRWFEFLKENNLDPMKLALSYINNLNIDVSTIIGVDNPAQLNMIVKKVNFKNDFFIYNNIIINKQWNDILKNKKILIDPRKWK